MNQPEEEKRYIAITKAALTTNNTKSILAKIRELKNTGKISILSYILDLLKPGQNPEIKAEIFDLVSNLSHQQGVPFVVKHIKQLKGTDDLSPLIASCWQSQLDYSDYLETFADCFITGSYQDAIESFTVIEEMIFFSNIIKIDKCRSYLLGRQPEVGKEKQPLFTELIKILTQNN